jgi:hypothetical protein
VWRLPWVLVFALVWVLVLVLVLALARVELAPASSMAAFGLGREW